MTEMLGNLGSNPMIHDFLSSLMTGEITLLTGLFWLMIATIISMIGGAVGGILLAGKELGYELAATMGSLFGPAGVIPVAAIGLIVLKLV
ncbi:conserved hypothetical protein [Rippkaea orientalis PCC 8801]|uniref:Uncharacterized protein n=1 Tax=Rippkaea orientalis (strain PCC 8801 / RF-1) TaxID=41431 RepID=B7K3H6_RIPO1|nr:hypothetical protein [Rippkaea orientalis]ACK65318.1 conserved hypothetical protein [Rippkaea orientalis PCC 8801]